MILNVVCVSLCRCCRLFACCLLMSLFICWQVVVVGCLMLLDCSFEALCYSFVRCMLSSSSVCSFVVCRRRLQLVAVAIRSFIACCHRRWFICLLLVVVVTIVCLLLVVVHCLLLLSLSLFARCLLSQIFLFVVRTRCS